MTEELCGFKSMFRNCKYIMEKTQKQVLYNTRHLIINMNKVHQ